MADSNRANFSVAPSRRGYLPSKHTVHHRQCPHCSLYCYIVLRRAAAVTQGRTTRVHLQQQAVGPLLSVLEQIHSGIPGRERYRRSTKPVTIRMTPIRSSSRGTVSRLALPNQKTRASEHALSKLHLGKNRAINRSTSKQPVGLAPFFAAASTPKRSAHSAGKACFLFTVNGACVLDRYTGKKKQFTKTLIITQAKGNVQRGQASSIDHKRNLKKHQSKIKTLAPHQPKWYQRHDSRNKMTGRDGTEAARHAQQDRGLIDEPAPYTECHGPPPGGLHGISCPTAEAPRRIPDQNAHWFDESANKHSYETASDVSFSMQRRAMEIKTDNAEPARATIIRAMAVHRLTFAPWLSP